MIYLATPHLLWKFRRENPTKLDLPDHMIVSILLGQYWKIGDFISSDRQWIFKPNEWRDFLNHEVETGHLTYEEAFLKAFEYA